MSKRIAWRNFADTITSYLRSNDTVSRVRTVADRDGRLLDDTDLTNLTIHDRGTWNTLNQLPNGTGSGTAGANVKNDYWFVPVGGWTYQGQPFPQWTKIEAMTNGANTVDNFKFYL
jgi:hypothetical protein